MAKTPFVTLVFQGTRFGNAAMPLEALPELAAYRELVVATAKALFQARNPSRQRLPKGFEDGLRLVLERVEAGSAVPIINRVVEGHDQLLLVPTGETPDLFEEARKLVQEGIAGGGFPAEAMPSELSKQVLARFNAFGRSLGPDEAIIVADPGSRQGARYTREVRRRLVLQAQTTYEDEVDMLGDVRAADKDADGFTLRTSEGKKILVRAPPLFFPLALRSLGDAAPVRVRFRLDPCRGGFRGNQVATGGTGSPGTPGYIPRSAPARYVARQPRGSAASLSPAWSRGSRACGCETVG